MLIILFCNWEWWYWGLGLIKFEDNLFESFVIGEKNLVFIRYVFC